MNYLLESCYLYQLLFVSVGTNLTFNRYKFTKKGIYYLITRLVRGSIHKEDRARNVLKWPLWKMAPEKMKLPKNWPQQKIPAKNETNHFDSMKYSQHRIQLLVCDSAKTIILLIIRGYTSPWSTLECNVFHRFL